MTSAAADVLRQALADAPDGLHVAPDGNGELDLFNGYACPIQDWNDWQAVFPLIGLLLAAAPELAAALDRVGAGPPQDLTYYLLGMRDAIAEAAQAMEAES